MRRKGFIAVSAGALALAACGRQVTPNKGYAATGSGLNPGFMSIRFRVTGQLNFSQYNYMVVFNTTGNGVTPLPLGRNNSFVGYSFALIVSGATGAAVATAWQYFRPAGISNTQQPTLLSLGTVPSQLIFTPNSNGLGNEFNIIFDRAIALGVATPTPGASTPTPHPTVTPTTSPTSSASPTPTPTATPTAVPSGFSDIWLLNLFVTNAAVPSPGSNLVPLDSLGVGGPTDQTYISPQYNTTQTFDNTIIAYFGGGVAGGDPNAQIANSEIANAP